LAAEPGLRRSPAACSSPYLYVAVRRLLELLVLGRRSEADKDLEIVVLATSSPCSVGR